MFCNKCGSKLSSDAKFCQSCGQVSIPQPTQQTPVPQPFQTTGTAIKCANCGYIGVGEKARSPVAVFFAWLSVIVVPLITIIYFLATHKWRCPKCKSTFVGVKNKDGVYVSQSGGGHAVIIIISIFVGIAVIGILASVVLASLSGARERALEASKKLESTEVSSENIEINEILNEAINEYALQLPIEIDSDTELSDVYVTNDNILVYKYKLTTISKSDIEWIDIKEFILPTAQTQYCHHPDIQIYRDYNIPMRWSYTDMDNNYLGFIEISNDDCLD